MQPRADDWDYEHWLYKIEALKPLIFMAST
jgi:hypothetical protein